jgi:exodeoxyribonuclease V alpha subunit
VSIIAALDKVLFHNDATKYTVLRMKTEDTSVPDGAKSPYHYRDHLIRFTATGYDLPRTDTVQFELEGEWTATVKYGCQLQVEHWQEIVPPTLEGVRNYLASGLLKGIGEKTADAIVQKFGVQALTVLEKQPERLLEIKGITPERLAEIQEGYAQTRRMRDLMTLLAPFKVTPATALRIYQHFGPSCADIVRESPFNLCQVPGFGFKRVDAIVQKSGGDLHDPKRVHGALFYTLEDARSKSGHLYLESEAVLKGATQLLNEKIPLPAMRIPAKQVEHALETMILSDEVVSNRGNIYLPKAFVQESETAQRVVQLLLERPEPVNIAQALAEVKEQLGIRLSGKQNDGVEMAFQHNLSIITGGPGTGKTTVLKTVIEVFRKLYPDKKLALAAPTGKASRRMAEATGRMDAQTLHSLLGLYGEGSGWKGKEEQELLDADLLIVDETSMVDMWLAHQLFSRLRPGTKVLLVGDADQLESVGAGNVFHELIDSGVVPVTVLDEIFRQAKDSLIAYNAKFIHEEKTTLYYGQDFAFIKAEDQAQAAELIRTLYQEQAAISGMDQVEILCPFRTEGEVSAMNLNQAIREEVNPFSPDKPETGFGSSVFRLHDRVMQTKNNYDVKLYDKDHVQVGKGVFNGDIGTVCAVYPDQITIDFDGRFMNCPLEMLSELELAYAMTIHKAMGSGANRS